MKRKEAKENPSEFGKEWRNEKWKIKIWNRDKEDRQNNSNNRNHRKKNKEHAKPKQYTKKKKESNKSPSLKWIC